MVWDPVPWFIGGGAKHSVNVARLLTYIGSSGREGVIEPTDLEVLARVTPSGSIRVMPGACAVLNRGQGVTHEAYAGRNPTEEIVNIAPTTSEERTDLIVARIENPFQTGEPWTQPTPAAVEAGTAQFVRSALIANVDKTKSARQILDPLGYSAIPLAMVTLPPSTSTVQQIHVTDLRSLLDAQQSDPLMVVANGPTTPQLLTATTYSSWPQDVSTQVTIPSWANRVNMKALVGGIRFGATGNNGGAGWNTKGTLRVVLGSGDSIIASQPTNYDFSVDASVDRGIAIAAGAGIFIPKPVRGTTVAARIQGLKTSGTTDLRADTGTTAILEVQFFQRAASST